MDYYYFVSSTGGRNSVITRNAILATSEINAKDKAKDLGLIDAGCSVYKINEDQIKPYNLNIL